MAKIHFDITGDNSDFVSTINDTSKRLETFSTMMKDLGDSGLDMSNPKAQLRSLQQVIEENEKIIQDYKTQIEELAQAQRSAALAGDTAQVEAYGREIEALTIPMQSVINTTEQQKQAFNELSGSMTKEEGIMVKLLGGQEKYNAIMQGLPPSLKGAVSGINGMTKAAKAFIATPLGAILAAIILAFKALQTWLSKTAEGQKVLAKVSGYLSGVLTAITNVVKKVGEALFKAFKDPKQAAKDFVNFLKDQVVNRLKAIGGMFSSLGKIIAKTFTGDWDAVKEAGKELGENFIMFQTGLETNKLKESVNKLKEFVKEVDDVGKKMAELSARSHQLSIDRANWEAKEEELQLRLNELQNKMYSGSKQEQEKAAIEAESVINAIYAQRVKFAKEEYDIQKEKNKIPGSSQEDYNEEAHLKAAITKEYAARESALRMFKRRGTSATEAAIAAEIKMENELNALQLQNQDKRIAQLKNEGERTVDQINANYDKEMEAIRKKRKEWEDDRRKDSGDATLSPDQEKALAEAAGLASMERSLALEKAAKQDYLKFTEYLKQYGSFEEKRLAITKEYEEKIRQAREAGDTYGEKQLVKQKDTELASLKATKLIEDSNLAMVFSDLGLVLSAPLKETVDQLRKYTETGDFRSRSIEEQKHIFEAIAKAEQKLGQLDSLDFKGLGTSVQEYTIALAQREEADRRSAAAALALAAAEDKLTKAKESGNKETIASAQAERDKALAVRESSDAEYQKAASEVIRTQSNATASLTKFNAAVNRISSSISQLYSGKLAGLWNLLGPDFANRLGMVVSGSKKVVDSFNKLGETLKKNGSSIDEFSRKAGDVFTEVFGKFEDKSEGLKQGISAVEELFAGNGAEELGKKVGGDLSKGLSKGIAEGKTADELGKTVSSTVGGIAASAEASGNVYGMLIGVFIDLLDEFAEHGVGEIVSTLLENIGTAVEGILTHLLEGWADIVTKGMTGLLSGLIKGISKWLTLGFFNDEIDKWFGGTGLSDEEIESLTKSNESLERAINNLKDEISKSDATNKESIEAYKMAIDASNQRRDNLRTLMLEEVGAYKKGFFGIGGEHSSLYKIEMQIDKDAFQQIESLIGHSLGSDKVLGLFGMSPEEWKLVADYLPSIYGEILAAGSEGYKDISEYIEKYVEEAGRLEELEFSLGEKLTGVSWDSFLSDFKSVLKDMDSSAADFADSFEKMLSDAILDSLVNEKYRERLKQLYKKFVDYSSEESLGGTALTIEEENELKKIREQIANDAIADRERLRQLGLISTESEAEKQKAATAGGFKTMSQDTANELNGRFTALQLSNEVISKSAQDGLSYIVTISNVVSANNSVLSDIRNLHTLEVGYLEDISKYTKTIITFGDKLDKIEQHTAKL